jgi:hypothetical protein
MSCCGHLLPSHYDSMLKHLESAKADLHSWEGGREVRLSEGGSEWWRMGGREGEIELGPLTRRRNFPAVPSKLRPGNSKTGLGLQHTWRAELSLSPSLICQYRQLQTSSYWEKDFSVLLLCQPSMSLLLLVLEYCLFLLDRPC